MVEFSLVLGLLELSHQYCLRKSKERGKHFLLWLRNVPSRGAGKVCHGSVHNRLSVESPFLIRKCYKLDLRG